MVLDTSALVAMLNDEPQAPGLEAAVAAAPVREPLLFKGDDFGHTDIDAVNADG